MTLNTIPDISLQIVEYDNPLLLHKRVIELSFPEESESLAIKTITQNSKKACAFAEVVDVSQLKIKSSPQWNNLGKQLFVPAVYKLTIPAEKIRTATENSFEVVRTETIAPFHNLVSDFINHLHTIDPHYFAPPLPETVQTFIRSVDESVTLGNGFILIASRDMKDVGFLYAVNGTEHGKIEAVFLPEIHREKGAGKALLSASRFNFVEMGCTQIKTYVPAQCPSLLFFEKLGFEKQEIHWIRNLNPEGKD